MVRDTTRARGIIGGARGFAVFRVRAGIVTHRSNAEGRCQRAIGGPKRRGSSRSSRYVTPDFLLLRWCRDYVAPTHIPRHSYESRNPLVRPSRALASEEPMDADFRQHDDCVGCRALCSHFPPTDAGPARGSPPGCVSQRQAAARHHRRTDIRQCRKADQSAARLSGPRGTGGECGMGLRAGQRAMGVGRGGSKVDGV